MHGKCRTRFSDYEFFDVEMLLHALCERFGRLRRVGMDYGDNGRPLPCDSVGKFQQPRKGSWESTDLVYYAGHPVIDYEDKLEGQKGCMSGLAAAYPAAFPLVLQGGYGGERKDAGF